MRPIDIIMDFTGICVHEAIVDIKSISAHYVNCKDIEGTNCYCSDEAAKEINRRIENLPADAIHWIDTGDYHYNSLFWISRIEHEFSLLLFDRHPDMQQPAFDGILSCGDWVRQAINTLPHLSQVIIIGANRELWEEAEPYKDKISIYEAKDYESAIKAISHPVYISIDKDVLSKEWAATDWDQGDMTLNELLDAIKKTLTANQIIGVDICGGITTNKGATDKDFALNSVLNNSIREILF